MQVREARSAVTEGDNGVTVGNRASVEQEERLRRTEGPEGSAERALLLFLFAAGALLSPALLLWIAPGRPWWTLYAVWGVIIVAAALAQRGPR